MPSPSWPTWQNSTRSSTPSSRFRRPSESNSSDVAVNDEADKRGLRRYELAKGTNLIDYAEQLADQVKHLDGVKQGLPGESLVGRRHIPHGFVTEDRHDNARL